jgi:hypothetical protein
MASFYRWLSFISVSTTVVPVSHGYGGYQTATSPPNYTTTYATASYYTEAHKYYSDPSYYTESPAYYTIEAHWPTSTTPLRHWSITAQPTLPQSTTPRLPSITLLQLTTPRSPNTTLHPAKYPQLRRPRIMQYLLTTQRLLHRATLTRITTPRFQFTTPKSTLPPSYYTEAPVNCNTKAFEYYTTFTLLQPTTPKLRSITCPELQHHCKKTYTKSKIFLCKWKLIPNEYTFNASNYLVKLLNTSKHFKIATYSDFHFFRRTTVASVALNKNTLMLGRISFRQVTKKLVFVLNLLLYFYLT